jgi:hypothetical protein
VCEREKGREGEGAKRYDYMEKRKKENREDQGNERFFGVPEQRIQRKINREEKGKKN